MRILAVLFDLDETLYSREAAFERWVRSEAGTEPIDWQKIAALDARGRGNKAQLLEYLADTLDWAEHSLDERLARFRAGVARHVDVPDRTRAMLDRLRANYRLGLVSNGSSEAQRAKLRALGIAHHFDPILISEEVGVRKPDPRIFWMAAERWHIPREEILCVGDDPIADVEGALNAGLRAVRVGGAPAPGESLTALHELEDWLGAYGRHIVT